MSKIYTRELAQLEKKLTRAESSHQKLIGSIATRSEKARRLRTRIVAAADREYNKTLSALSREQAKAERTHEPARQTIMNRIAMLKQRLAS